MSIAILILFLAQAVGNSSTLHCQLFSSCQGSRIAGPKGLNPQPQPEVERHVKVPGVVTYVTCYRFLGQLSPAGSPSCISSLVRPIASSRANSPRDRFRSQVYMIPHWERRLLDVRKVAAVARSAPRVSVAQPEFPGV